MQRSPSRSATVSIGGRLLVCLVPWLVAGCEPGGNARPAAPPEEAAAESAPLGPETEARVAERAGPAADALATTLLGRLVEALESSAASEAMEFCSIEAQPLTAGLSGSLPEGMELKRTSLRYRNPMNAPDSSETRVLQEFQGMADRGEALPSYRVERQQDGSLRYYRPIRTAPMCLTCHGPVETLGTELRTTLRERYPEDRAVGYEAGEFRGLIRVTLPPDTAR